MRFEKNELKRKENVIHYISSFRDVSEKREVPKEGN